ncbi:glycerophosphoryl diester phosphodiesterase [Motilibacter peucedani]|uniref:Glycerophosphoryl diester phosphodiesterase n=1 Tax=Motilibacter peucedani TaxID=598650 RepID=A0A420XUN6_9ACTN|nr:glycerophosphodiester phosphodiesterase [Motilibacter peucedani]RKS80477.1 glycerophosphoryl diester phosphodiesterase [Motilibacter peucedani]
MTSGASGRRVLAAAHRGGNSVHALEQAADSGADIVELDVQPGPRLEVRHARDLAPLPLLLDRGRLRRGWGPRLHLDEVLDVVEELLPPTTRLLVDLKGTSTSIGAELAAVLERRGPSPRAVLVCGRHWPALDAFAGLPQVGVMLSAGKPGELALLRRRLADGTLVSGRPPAGVCLSHTLVDAPLVRELEAQLPLVLSWTVNRRTHLDRVLEAGVGGVITDRADFLRELSGVPAGR